jgi:hypothetical protein
MGKTLLSGKFWRDFLIMLLTCMATLLFLDHTFTANWKPTLEYFSTSFAVSIVLAVPINVSALLKKRNLKH